MSSDSQTTETPKSKSKSSGKAPTKHPTKLGRYIIKKKLGAGGMGTVYLASDTELNRTVALKVLARSKSRNEILVKRFNVEARAAAQLKHKNIVSVYDSGAEQGYLYIALEYIEGRDVQQQLKRQGPFPVSRVVDIIKQVAHALQHAFEQNIVHRDVKPSNLLVQRNGIVKLTDMGLARCIDETTEKGITRAGTTVGTVDYMSPEQARDSKLADIRSDIYSLGCTFYHMLTGQTPFNAGGLINTLNAHATAPRPDPRDLNDKVPQGIVDIIHKMMAPNPLDRFQTPATLITILEDPRVMSNSSLEISNADLASLSEGDEIEEEVRRQVLVSETETNANVNSRTRTTKPMPPARQPISRSSRSAASIDPIKACVFLVLVAVIVGGIIYAVIQFSSSIKMPEQPDAAAGQDGDDGSASKAGTTETVPNRTSAPTHDKSTTSRNEGGDNASSANRTRKRKAKITRRPPTSSSDSNDKPKNGTSNKSSATDRRPGQKPKF